MAAVAEGTRLRPAAYAGEINGQPIPLGPWEPSRAQPGTLRPFPTRGPEVCDWIEANCIFTDRRWVDEPFVLEPWQRQLIYDLFEINPENGRRRYRWALIGMARKNGKTQLMAALALWFLLGEQSADLPNIVVAATSEEQAGEIFGAAAYMAEYSPTLSQITSVSPSGVIFSLLRPRAKIIRVSSKARTAHGKNISHLILDELHEWPPGPGDALWTALTTGMSAGLEPLTLQITTAGANVDVGVCGQQYELGRQIESGEVRDDAYFFRWWAAPENCRLDDPEAHRLANPAYGVIKMPEYFEDMLPPRIPEADYRRLELNQWVAASGSFLPDGTWAACRVRPGPWDGAEALLSEVQAWARAEGEDIDEEEAESRKRQAKAVRELLGFGFVPGPAIHIGLDASRRGDSTALVAAQEQEIDGQPRIRLGAWIWERPFDPRTKRPQDDWLMPIEEVYDVLRGVRRWFNLVAVPHDPALIQWEVRKWLAAGMPMVEINQGGAIMERAGQGLYEAATSGLIAHDGNAGLARHIANAASKPVARGSGAQRLVKVEQSRKMDAAVSAAMAIWSLLHPPEGKKAAKKPPSIYIMDDDD